VGWLRRCDCPVSYESPLMRATLLGQSAPLPVRALTQLSPPPRALRRAAHLALPVLRQQPLRPPPVPRAVARVAAPRGRVLSVRGLPLQARLAGGEGVGGRRRPRRCGRHDGPALPSRRRPQRALAVPGAPAATRRSRPPTGPAGTATRARGGRPSWGRAPRWSRSSRWSYRPWWWRSGSSPPSAGEARGEKRRSGSVLILPLTASACDATARRGGRVARWQHRWLLGEHSCGQCARAGTNCPLPWWTS
jgi:hypothetical protein